MTSTAIDVAFPSGVGCAATFGEQPHAQGADGARRAKLWLDSATRASVWWVDPDLVAVPKLTFKWADDATFSFDLCGVGRTRLTGPGPARTANGRLAGVVRVAHQHRLHPRYRHLTSREKIQLTAT
jgi:hypothetical protein